ncbi:undecaprenyl/decaprenyl-phosphate alpha-N-acetylglucosaminyl 1-phosphate transferase [Flavobacteriaceae bacterium]|nr:undecaprenyl/decaprenyl-phosphate alpha-N-acetylglucosaminyl 1-phosphate transferase [Flavobacteriaceae bacterium]
MELSLLVVAFIIATLLHFGVQKLFIYYKRFDDFNHRSSHKTLATRTGGIGVFLTVLIISLYYYFQGIELFDYSLFIPLGIMFVIGVYDDLYNADFKLKFLLQIIVAKILIDQGYVISNYHGLFGLYQVPWLLAQVSTVFVFLVVANAINFIDGIDGLAITEVVKVILVIEIFSAGFTRISPLGLLVISSIVPLYYFNFKKKRKVFLGDGGSMLLGTVTMVYILFLLGDGFEFEPNFLVNKTLFAVLILLYPLIDLLRVFVLRIKEGKSPFLADQSHIHHFLLKIFENHFITTITILFLQFFVLLVYLSHKLI